VGGEDSALSSGLGLGWVSGGLSSSCGSLGFGVRREGHLEVIIAVQQILKRYAAPVAATCKGNVSTRHCEAFVDTKEPSPQAAYCSHCAMLADNMCFVELTNWLERVLHRDSTRWGSVAHNCEERTVDRQSCVIAAGLPECWE